MTRGLPGAGVSLLFKVSLDAGVWERETSVGWDPHTALAVRLWVRRPHLGLGLSIHKKEARPPCDGVLCEDAWPLTSPSAAPRPAPTHPPPPLQPAVLSGEGLPVSPGAWPEPRAPHSIPGRQHRWSGLLGAVSSACRSVRRLGLPWCALGPAAWPGSVTSEALPGEPGSSASGLSPGFCPPDLSRVLAQVPFVLGLGGQGPRGGRRDRKRQGGRLGPWSLS